MTLFRASLLSLALAATTLPAQQVMLNKGTFEVGGSAQLDSDVLAASARFGAFVKDYLQVGIKLDLADSARATRVGLSAYGIHLFETNTYVLPYVGGSLGFATLDSGVGSSETGAEIALLGGLKYYMADNASLNTELSIGFGSGDTFLDDRRGDSSKVLLTIGLGFHW